jgi:crotonobetainyl-CoA:carnitine CoA-transferase CaiB-like acyl-CoA transferase
VLQAICGLMSINGTPESGAMRVGVPIVDYVTGYNALAGVLLALAARERTGTGQRVEVTLFDTALGLLVPHAAINSLFKAGVVAPNEMQNHDDKKNHQERKPSC